MPTPPQSSNHGLYITFYLTFLSDLSVLFQLRTQSVCSGQLQYFCCNFEEEKVTIFYCFCLIFFKNKLSFGFASLPRPRTPVPSVWPWACPHSPLRHIHPVEPGGEAVRQEEGGGLDGADGQAQCFWDQLGTIWFTLKKY